MTKPAILFLILFLPVVLIAQNTLVEPVRPIVLRNVNLIDMRSDSVSPKMTILVSGGRIVKIGKSVTAPKNAQIVDATGKYLIPGLWDNYTFTLEAEKNGAPFFELLLAHGVTGVRDVGTSMDLVNAAKLRADINAGRVIGPRLFYAGTVLQGEMPPRRSNRWSEISTVVKTAEEARAAVEKLAGAGVDHIKVEKRTRPEILREIIRTAHEYKLPVVAVPPSFVMDASNDGLDCIEHFAEFFRETSDKRSEYYALYRDHKIDSMTRDENYAFFGTMKIDELYYKETVRTMARNQTFVATNAAQTFTFIGDFELNDSSRRRFKTKKQLADLQAAIAERERQISTHDYRMSDENRKRHFREIVDLNTAGIPLLAGTQSSYDSDSVGTPGAILHDELAIFVLAGLSPFEALKTVTVNPAAFMHREKDLGTIEVRKLADLVLLDANPFANIANTRKINAVVVNGRYLSRDQLNSMLSDVEAKAKNQ